MRRVLAALVLSLASAWPVHAKPVRILFVGNALLEDAEVPARFASLARAMGKEAEVQSRIVRWASLEDHWRDGETRAAIAKGWDYVVLQQGPSAREEERADLAAQAKRFTAEIAKTGAKTALFMAWPQEPERRRDIPAAIAAYRAAAEASGALLIPAAEAWLRVLAQTKPGRSSFSPRGAASDLAVLTSWFVLFPAGPQEFTEDYVERASRELGIDPARRDAWFDAATRAIDEPMPLGARRIP